MYRDLLHRLNGTWLLERTTPGLGTMTGSAVITAISSSESTYEETGTTTTAEGRSFQFRRRYRYRAGEDSLDILFDETPPRLYQSIRLTVDAGDLIGSGYHLCQPDEYRSSYRFALPERFSTAHSVTGPRKSYTIETTYRRGP